MLDLSETKQDHHLEKISKFTLSRHQTSTKTKFTLSRHQTSTKSHGTPLEDKHSILVVTTLEDQ